MWASCTLLLALLATSAQAQTVEYIHTDALGSVVAVTDADGNVIERREYEPYGHQLTPAVTDGPGYTGHVQDAATGLVYMQQRYYDAQIGRFLSVDPVTAHEQPGQNFNRYWYANNNPYRFTDPDGRAACVIAPPTPVCIAAVIEAAKVVGAVLTVGAAGYGGYKASEYLNESAEGQSGGESAGPNAKAPELPGKLVGENPTARGSGNSVTSGPLTPENGGTGDYDSDLETLAGETRPAEPGDKAPPGAQIGENGVFGRPGNSSGGRSIDIPAKGDKPHETLHYPRTK